MSTVTTISLTGAMVFTCVVLSVAQELDTRAGRLHQQRQAKAMQLQLPKKNAIETALFEFKNRRLIERYQAGYKGFHPVFGGLSTGSGFAFGTEYLKSGLAEGSLDFHTSAQASFVGYQRYRLGLTAPKLAREHLVLSSERTSDSPPSRRFFRPTTRRVSTISLTTSTREDLPAWIFATRS
jgi:hypothetical protein